MAAWSPLCMHSTIIILAPGKKAERTRHSILHLFLNWYQGRDELHAKIFLHYILPSKFVSKGKNDKGYGKLFRVREIPHLDPHGDISANITTLATGKLNPR